MGVEWSRPTKYIVGVALALLGIYVLYLSQPVIPLLVIAGLIAFAVRPVIGLLHERIGLPRGVAVALTYLALLLLLPLAAVLALAALAEALNFVLGIDYGAVFDGVVTGLEGWLVTLRGWVIPVGPLDAYVDGLIDSLLTTTNGASELLEPQLPSLPDLASQLGAALSITFGAVAGLVGNLFTSAILFIFVLLSAIYLSLNAASYREAMVRALPAAVQPEVVELLRRIGVVWVAFFRGQVTLMVIIGAIVWVGLSLLGVPGALSLAIIAGLLEVVPNLGPVVATIPAVVVALLQGSNYLPINNFVLALLVLGFYILVQQLENGLIVPRVLGDAVELPALVVMAGVFVGGSAAGILGALLATPVIATGREVLSYVYRKLLGEAPFPPAPAPAAPAPAPASLWQRLGLRRPAPPRVEPAQEPAPAEPDAPPADARAE